MNPPPRSAAARAEGPRHADLLLHQLVVGLPLSQALHVVGDVARAFGPHLAAVEEILVFLPQVGEYLALDDGDGRWFEPETDFSFRRRRPGLRCLARLLALPGLLPLRLFLALAGGRHCEGAREA